MEGNLADFIELIFAVDVLHVATEFGDKHPAIAVKGNHPWLLNFGFTDDQFHAVAWRELESFCFLLGGLGEVWGYGGGRFGLRGWGGEEKAVSEEGATEEFRVEEIEGVFHEIGLGLKSLG